jgi:hypothetical protein
LLASLDLLVLLVELFGLSDVSLLGRLIATNEQQDKFISASREVQTVTRPIVYVQLANTLPNCFGVTQVARKRYTPNAQVDTCLGVGIPQLPEPPSELVCPIYLQHG